MPVLTEMPEKQLLTFKSLNLSMLVFFQLITGIDQAHNPAKKNSVYSLTLRATVRHCLKYSFNIMKLANARLKRGK